MINLISSDLDQALVHLKKRQNEDKNFTWEIIIVDDGSRDKTTEVALAYTKIEGDHLFRHFVQIQQLFTLINTKLNAVELEKYKKMCDQITKIRE